MLHLKLVQVASLNFKVAINHYTENNLWEKLVLLKSGSDLSKKYALIFLYRYFIVV